MLCVFADILEHVNSWVISSTNIFEVSFLMTNRDRHFYISVTVLSWGKNCRNHSLFKWYEYKLSWTGTSIYSLIVVNDDVRAILRKDFVTTTKSRWKDRYLYDYGTEKYQHPDFFIQKRTKSFTEERFVVLMTILLRSYSDDRDTRKQLNPLQQYIRPKDFLWWNLTHADYWNRKRTK